MNSLREKICFILLPGFSPDEIPVFIIKDALEKRGYEAVTSNFFGDIVIKDFKELNVEECQKSVSSTINSLANKYDKVIGIGISLGGALLLEHVKKNNNLYGIVSIGTPFKLRYQSLLSIGEFLLPIFYPIWHFFEKFKKLRLLPIGAGPNVIFYLKNDFLKNLENIHTPILFLHSKKDFVTDYKVLPFFSQKIGSEHKQIIFSEDGNHVIDHDMEFIVDNLVKFFNLS